MAIVDRLLHITIAICLLFMVYTQYNFIRASWCEYDVDKILFTLEDIAEELNVK